MPGHMHVLLAEANVPYEELVDLDEINPQFPQANVALVVGANDVTNPAARRPGTPVSGMPILDVDKSQNVVVMKRGRGMGYAGIQNELYFEDNTQMLFGDAKKSLQSVIGVRLRGVAHTRVLPSVSFAGGSPHRGEPSSISTTAQTPA